MQPCALVVDDGTTVQPTTIVENEIHVPISSDQGVLAARHEGRVLAAKMGFPPSDSTLIATAISELARNIVSYAGRGEIVLRASYDFDRLGVMVVARDDGPGIPSIDQALRDGYSTSGGLGLGLPGVRRLMDEFEIVSEVGRGTTVTTRKWKVWANSQKLVPSYAAWQDGGDYQTSADAHWNCKP